jgi:DNA primase
MYFFNQSRGIQVEFNVVIHLDPMPLLMFSLTRVAVAQHGKNLVEMSGLDVYVLAPCLPLVM